MTGIPTIDILSNILEITPDFLKKNIFLIFLFGDTLLSTIFNFFTGYNFLGFSGTIISIIGSILLSLVFHTLVPFIVASWQIFFVYMLIEFGLLGLIYSLLLSRFRN